MICPNCHRTNPEDAHFCIYCAVPLVAAESFRPPPATGPTQVLDPPLASPAAAPAIATCSHHLASCVQQPGPLLIVPPPPAVRGEGRTRSSLGRHVIPDWP